MAKKSFKEAGSLTIHSVREEDCGVITLSINETGCVSLYISQTHDHGMDAEIEVTFEEYERVSKALEKANDIILSGISHGERYEVDLIKVNGPSLKRQGFILINVFEQSIILVISLTHGGDPDIRIDQEEIPLLVSLFKRIKRHEPHNLEITE
ncbi:hypothetical protein [Paenibacillus sp. 1P03SA]|uniref:hypothetical protein n=1 Tax=Paenibacillus sp. 1P03SA TaxID=3132294 RepID=UPI0039A33DDC